MDQSTINFYKDNARQVAERYESVVSDLSKHFSDASEKCFDKSLTTDS